jgi:hypothetical protein
MMLQIWMLLFANQRPIDVAAIAKGGSILR